MTQILQSKQEYARAVPTKGTNKYKPLVVRAVKQRKEEVVLALLEVPCYE